MANIFPAPFKHPRHIIGDRPKLTKDRVTEMRVTDYVTSRMKERSLQVPIGELALSSPTLSTIAVGTVVAPLAVPVMVTAIAHTLTGLDYD